MTMQPSFCLAWGGGAFETVYLFYLWGIVHSGTGGQVGLYRSALSVPTGRSVWLPVAVAGDGGAGAVASDRCMQPRKRTAVTDARPSCHYAGRPRDRCGHRRFRSGCIRASLFGTNLSFCSLRRRCVFPSGANGTPSNGLFAPEEAVDVFGGPAAGCDGPDDERSAGHGVSGDEYLVVRSALGVVAQNVLAVVES